MIIYGLIVLFCGLAWFGLITAAMWAWEVLA